MIEHLKEQIKEIILESEDPLSVIEQIRDVLHEFSPVRSMPVDRVRWVHIDRVRANEYNPNSVAKNEMRLLHTSISHDGYTQPVVAVYDEDDDMYTVIDGFHRYSTMKHNADIREKTGGLLPVVVLDISMNDRMASTVRHNRARGKHAVTGMANMVFEMLDNGWSDEEICRQLGMEADEIVRLKHVTGFSKLFENAEWRQAWESRKQVARRIEYERRQAIYARGELPNDGYVAAYKMERDDIQRQENEIRERIAREEGQIK